MQRLQDEKRATESTEDTENTDKEQLPACSSRIADTPAWMTD